MTEVAASPDPDPHLERCAWAVPALLVPLAISAPVFFGRVFLYRDVLGLVIPQQVLRARGLASGRLAEWNPLSYGGAPHLADPGVGTFYPFNLLFSFVGDPALAATVFILLHLAIAGAGVYLLLNRTQGHRPAMAAMGAVAYQTSGYLLSMHGMHYACSSVALLPLVLVLLLGAAAKQAAGATPLGAAGFALLVFNGEWQVASFAVVLSFALVAAGSDRWRRLLRLAACGALGIGLSAVQLVPTLLYSRQTTRADGVPLAEASDWSLNPLRLVEWLLPSPFGLPYPENHYFGAALVEAHRSSPWAAGLSLAACFSLGILLLRWRGAAREQWVWAAVGSGALLLALGHHTPVFALWWRLVPLADRFRYPEKFAAVVTLALVVLAVRGFADSLASTARCHRVLFVLPIACGLFSSWIALEPALVVRFVTDGLLRAVANASPETALDELRFSLLFTAASGAVLLSGFEIARRRAGAGLALALVAVSAGGLWQAFRLLSWGDGTFLKSRSALVGQLLAQRDDQLADRVFREICPFVPVDRDGTLLERVRRWEWNSGKANFPALAGVRDAIGYGPAESADKWEVFRALRAVDGARLLRLLGVSHVVRCTPAGAITLEQVVDPLRRVAMVRGVLVAPDAVIPTLASSAHDLSTAAVVTDAALALPPVARAGATLIEDRPELLRIRVIGGGLLRVLDSFADGWTATVDGEPAPLRRADLLWRGVGTGPGDHEVILRYRTPGLVVGAWTSLCSLLVALLLLAKSERAGSPATART